MTVTPLEKQNSSLGDHETLCVGPWRPTTSGKTKKTMKTPGIVSSVSTMSELVKPIVRSAPLRKKEGKNGS